MTDVESHSEASYDAVVMSNKDAAILERLAHAKPRRHPVTDDELFALVRWHAARPCNQDGADKTAVLRTLRNMQRFIAEARPELDAST